MFKKKFLVFIFLIYILSNLNPIKFRIQTKDEKEIILQAIFDTGFSMKGVSDGFGVTDYESVFFKPAFFINDFGIGLDFHFRLRFFSGEASFITKDWSNYESKIETLYAYLDKIDYIRYGDTTKPIFFNIGKNPVTTLGSGLLVNDFHNYAFLSVSKEQGLFFKFNGNNLTEFKRNNIPFDITFLITDLLDPDIFIIDAGFDLFKLTKLREKEAFSLRIGQIYAIDINCAESNRLSSINDEEEFITSHRNLTATNSVFTSAPLFTSFYTDFTWKHDLVKINGYEEIGMLFNISDYNFNPGYTFGIGSKQGVEVRVVNLKESGYLVGITAGVIVESPNYSMYYFSSNYEVVRTKQYINLQYGYSLTPSIFAGFGLYGFNEKIKFNFMATIPLTSLFKMKLSAKFILENTLVKGLFLSVFYETGVNSLSLAGAGSGFMNFLTDGFRFSFDGGYKFYSAKLNVSFGMQRAGWVTPKYNLETGDINSDQYWKDIQKFVSLELSFIL